MSGFLAVKNWERYQHYRDRRPPWIKLHSQILNDVIFCKLPAASRGLLMCIWVLAAEDDGRVVCDEESLRFRLRLEKFRLLDLIPLIGSGFLVPDSDCQQLSAGASGCVPSVSVSVSNSVSKEGVRGRGKAVSEDPPTIEEVRTHIAEKAYHFTAEEFVGKGEAVGWVDKNRIPLKSWRGWAATWEANYRRTHPELQPLARSSKCVRDNRPRAEGSMFCTTCLEEIAAQARQMGAEVK